MPSGFMEKNNCGVNEKQTDFLIANGRNKTSYAYI